MGYILPITPFHSIQYSNRIDFERENRQAIKSLIGNERIAPLSSLSSYTDYQQLLETKKQHQPISLEEQKKFTSSITGIGVFIDVYV